MDNLSHALAGLAAAELIHRCLPRESTADRHSRRRRLMLVTGAAAGNFPDLDIFLTYLLPAPLGYLLHHRGHTHTLLYAIPQAAALAALLLLFWPSARRLVSQSRTAVGGFLMVLATGFLLHLGMDYLNSYGVHPFYPLDTRWLYGDMIFIVEPLFWVALGAPLFMMLRSRWLMLLLSIALVSAIAYFSRAGFLSWTSFALLTAVAAILLVTQYLSDLKGQDGLKSGGGLLAGIAVCFLYVGIQGMTSAQARQIVAGALEQQTPGTRIMDIAMTPFPAHPFCWMFASIEQKDDLYHARRGVLSLLPERLPAADCPAGFVQIPPDLQDDYSQASILTSYRGSVSRLSEFHEESCHLQAWMRFARIPVLSESRAWDLRFERGGQNFTEIDLAQAARTECPRGVPQWGKPRNDLLEQGKEGS